MFDVPAEQQIVRGLPDGPALSYADEANKARIEPLNSLNPTGGVFVGYTPQLRATQPLGDNITTLDRTMGGSPDDLITIYRGAPKSQKGINPGDFITDLPQLAKDYAGNGQVLKMTVRRGDVLNDVSEPFGNEYIYRPNADKEIKSAMRQTKKGGLLAPRGKGK
jgi:hypothetical protein